MKKKSAIMQIMIMMMMNMMKVNEITSGAGRIFGAGGWETIRSKNETRLRQLHDKGLEGRTRQG